MDKQKLLQQMKKVHFSAITFLISLCIISIPISVFYAQIEDSLTLELGKNARNTAIATAEIIVRDIEPYIELSEYACTLEGTYDRNYYLEMNALLRRIKSSTEAKYVYTEVLCSNSYTAYVLDGELPDEVSPIGAREKITEDIKYRVFTEKVVATSGMANDSLWGNLLTGYAPIINPKNNEVIGVVGVDFASDYLANISYKLKVIIWLGALCLAVLTSWFIYKIRHIEEIGLNRDYLTGLFSKRYYERRLDKVIRIAQITKKPFSFVMIDVDDFKQINDHYGHLVGDSVLKHVANILKSNLRSVDFCSRYGGDEFILLFGMSGKETAKAICSRIMKAIIGLRFTAPDGSFIDVGLSMGIVEWQPGMSKEKLIKAADEAMYLSKNAGKNTITVYE